MDIFENSRYARPISLIIESLLKIATNNSVQASFPEIVPCAEDVESALKKGGLPSLEQAVINLYIRLHGAGSVYSPQERETLAERKGYSCHPGGLWPLIKAAEFIRPESVVADLGAGNGLQGLLLQCLCPHRKTIQIELSAEMIRIGRLFQQALGLIADRVEWVHDDILNASIETADFIYLYLPAKPLDGGKEVYEAIARKLSMPKRPLVIFSVADCLAGFIDKQFSVSYTDGHLTCLVRE